MIYPQVGRCVLHKLTMTAASTHRGYAHHKQQCSGRRCVYVCVGGGGYIRGGAYVHKRIQVYMDSPTRQSDVCVCVCVCGGGGGSRLTALARSCKSHCASP